MKRQGIAEAAAAQADEVLRLEPADLLQFGSGLSTGPENDLGAGSMQRLGRLLVEGDQADDGGGVHRGAQVGQRPPVSLGEMRDQGYAMLGERRGQLLDEAAGPTIAPIG